MSKRKDILLFYAFIIISRVTCNFCSKKADNLYFTAWIFFIEYFPVEKYKSGYRYSWRNEIFLETWFFGLWCTLILVPKGIPSLENFLDQTEISSTFFQNDLMIPVILIKIRSSVIFDWEAEWLRRAKPLVIFKFERIGEGENWKYAA